MAKTIYKRCIPREQLERMCQYCQDCGKEKTFNDFRNCRECMDDVKAHIEFDYCKRCHERKRRSMAGLCPKCELEVNKLNKEARIWNPYYYSK